MDETNQLFELSPLGKTIKNRPEIHEFRAEILEHIMKTTSEFSPRNFGKYLENMICLFPQHVFFLKKYIESMKSYDVRLLFMRHPGSTLEGLNISKIPFIIINIK